MDTTVLLTDGKGDTDMVSTDAAVRATYASVATPGSISMGGNYSVLTCAGLKSSMLDAVGDRFYWKDSFAIYDLPAGYKQVEYIESTGTQYINTGVQLKYGDEFYFEFMKIISVSAENKGYGAGTSTAANYNITSGGRESGGNIAFWNGTNYSYSPNLKVADSYNQHYTEHWYIEDGKLYSTLENNTSGTIHTLSFNINKSYSSNNDLYLFRDNSSTYAYYSADRLYRCWHKQDEKLLYDFIPVYNENKREYGLIDILTGKYYSNSGSGSFIGGPIISYSEDLSLQAPWNRSAYESELTNTCTITTSSTNNKPFELYINPSVYLPKQNDGESKYYDVLTRQHKMQEALTIEDFLVQVRQRFEISPIGSESPNTIPEIWSKVLIYAKDYNKIAVAAKASSTIIGNTESGLYDTNFGTDVHPAKITSAYYELEVIPSGYSSIKSEGTSKKSILSTDEDDYQYNFCDAYKITLYVTMAKEIDGKTLNESFSISQIIHANTLASKPLVPYENYKLDETTLYYKDNVFAYNVANVFENHVLLKNGEDFDLSTVDKDIIHVGLPSRYSMLEYIESSGTQFIDTGVEFNYGDEFFFEFMKIKQLSGENKGYGAGVDTASSRNITSGGRESGGNIAFWNGTNYLYTPNIKVVDSYKKHYQEHWYMQDGKLYSSLLDYDSNSAFSLSINVAMDYASCNNVYLFRDNSTTYAYYSADRIYRCWHKKDGELVRDFIPVKDRTNGEYGLFDTVNGKFYGNAGTGVFTAGEELIPYYGYRLVGSVLYFDNNVFAYNVDDIVDGIVTLKNGETINLNNKNLDHSIIHLGLPSQYTIVDYIESSGTQYIDTDIELRYGDEFYFEFKKIKQLSGENKGYGAGINTAANYNITSGGREASGNIAFWNGTNYYYSPNIKVADSYGQHYIEHWYMDDGVLYSTLENTTNSSNHSLNYNVSKTYNSNNNLYLFRDNSSTYAYYSACRVYECWLKRDGMLIRHFIPVRTTSNEYGLYDLAGGKFYQNKGTDVFSGGNE